MSQKEKLSTNFLKTRLTAFFQTEAFRKAVLLHTIAVISPRPRHDWWSVDLRAGNVIHRATEDVYPDYHYPGVLSLEMLSEAELCELQHEAGLENLHVLREANLEDAYGARLEQLSTTAHEHLTLLAAVLEKHSAMLVETKRLMRRQL